MDEIGELFSSDGDLSTVDDQVLNPDLASSNTVNSNPRYFAAPEFFFRETKSPENPPGEITECAIIRYIFVKTIFCIIYLSIFK